MAQSLMTVILATMTEYVKHHLRPCVALVSAFLISGAGCNRAKNGAAMKTHHPDSHRDHDARSTEGGHRHHIKRTPEEWAQKLDADERDEWQKPERLVSLIQLEQGHTVAEIGAGTGYFLRYLSGAVGAEGRVLARDVEADLVDYMKKRAAREALPNVTAAICSHDDPALPCNSVDRILLVNTWHHISKRALYSKRLAEALGPRGRLYIVDFEKGSPIGPPPEDKLTPEEVLEELEAAGLNATRIEEDLPEQYVIVATTP